MKKNPLTIVLLAAGFALLTLTGLTACTDAGTPADNPAAPATVLAPTLPAEPADADADPIAEVAATAAALATEAASAPTAEPTAAADSPTAPAESAAPTEAAPTEAVAPAVPEPATVTSLPDPAGYAWNPVAQGLDVPVGIANAGDGSGRLFIIEKPGAIRILQDGDLLPTPFLDIRDRVGSRSSEQGLLGLDFHPRYAENGFFYVNYTDLNGDTVIARFQVTGSDPNLADPASELQILFQPQPFANHNGGAVVFGPDGYLYLGLGDGGSGGDPQGNAQSLNTWLGKILRLDVDGAEPYAIPADNPFTGGSKPEIWAYGLRNPWRFAFDRQTGDLYIGDVGQNQWEEINFLPAGSPGGGNFGWDYLEGTHPFEGSPPPDANLIPPVAEYDHGSGCSVTGGPVYRGPALPAWQGVYLYGDYCSGNIWGLLRSPDGSWQNSLLFRHPGNISAFGEDESGEVYLVEMAGGLYRLEER